MNITISILALMAIVWAVRFAVVQERRRTPQYLQDLYGKLNDEFFEGALPAARLEWSDLTDAQAVGQTFQEDDDDFVVQVDRRSNFWDDDELQDTIEHETCHIVTWEVETDPHGPKWQECMAHIHAK